MKPIFRYGCSMRSPGIVEQEIVLIESWVIRMTMHWVQLGKGGVPHKLTKNNLLVVSRNREPRVQKARKIRRNADNDLGLYFCLPFSDSAKTRTFQQ